MSYVVQTDEAPASSNPLASPNQREAMHASPSQREALLDGLQLRTEIASISLLCLSSESTLHDAAMRILVELNAMLPSSMNLQQHLSLVRDGLQDARARRSTQGLAPSILRADELIEVERAVTAWMQGKKYDVRQIDNDIVVQ